jgi:hypothetical protein
VYVAYLQINALKNNADVRQRVRSSQKKCCSPNPPRFRTAQVIRKALPVCDR